MMTRASGIALALILVHAGGCSKEKGPIETETCRNDEECEGRRICIRGMCEEPEGMVAMSEGRAPCRAHGDCELSGRCTTKDGQCVVASSADCEMCTECRREGRLTPKDGECVVGSDADCRKSPPCKQGRCTARNGKCVVASDADCRSSEDCKQHGLCAMGPQRRCMALTDGHCERSTFDCPVFGRCKVKAGRCAFGGASDADCRTGRGSEDFNPCAHDGLCTVEGGFCVARSDADCKRSVLCRRNGRCTATEGECVAGSGADCRQSEWCEHTKACTADKGRCVQ